MDGLECPICHTPYQELEARDDCIEFHNAPEQNQEWDEEQYNQGAERAAEDAANGSARKLHDTNAAFLEGYYDTMRAHIMRSAQ